MWRKAVALGLILSSVICCTSSSSSLAHLSCLLSNCPFIIKSKKHKKHICEKIIMIKERETIHKWQNCFLKLNLDILTWWVYRDRPAIRANQVPVRGTAAPLTDSVALTFQSLSHFFHYTHNIWSMGGNLSISRKKMHYIQVLEHTLCHQYFLIWQL